MDYYWHCGEYAYSQLVPGWRGLCSLVTMHSPTLAILGEELPELYQQPLRKKTTLPHQAHERRFADYFGWAQFKDIPEEFRLLTEAQLGQAGRYHSSPCK